MTGRERIVFLLGGVIGAICALLVLVRFELPVTPVPLSPKLSLMERIDKFQSICGDVYPFHVRVEGDVIDWHCLRPHPIRAPVRVQRPASDAPLPRGAEKAYTSRDREPTRPSPPSG